MGSDLHRAPAVAFLAAAVFGNLIDRVLVGGARDWLATPIAVANFADIAGWGTLLLFAVEAWRFPPARRLGRVWRLYPRGRLQATHRPPSPPGATPRGNHHE